MLQKFQMERLVVGLECGQEKTASCLLECMGCVCHSGEQSGWDVFVTRVNSLALSSTRRYLISSAGLNGSISHGPEN